MRVGKRLQLRHGPGTVGRIGDPELNAARLEADATRYRRFLLAESTADIIAEVRYHRLDDVGPVDLQQDVRPALQIEAKRQSSRLSPGRKTSVEGVASGDREQARDDDEQRGDDHRDDRYDLPGRETKHRYLSMAPGHRRPAFSSISRRP